MNDYSYLMKGLTRVPTTSSTLVSSSRYLNDPRIRDWLATHLLRKNGPDAPTPSDPMPLVLALREVQDIGHINELFAAERRKNSVLDQWFREGYVSSFRRENLKDYPPETTAGIFYKHEAVAHKLPYITLPPEINLGDARFAASYSQESYDTKTGEHVVGAPILFTITIPETVHQRAAALAFAEFVLASDQLLTQFGFSTMAHQVGGDAAQVPEELRG